MKRKVYSPEFKQRAVEKLASGAYTLRELSRELGVSVVSLLKWRDALSDPAGRKARTAQTVRKARTDEPSWADELHRLRAELARVKAERDRLRKGILYLAGGAG